MKNISLKITAFSLAAVMLVSSCSKKIDDAYQNPNADVRVAVESLLPQIVSAMAGNYAGHGTQPDMRFAGAYIQNWHYYTAGSVMDQMGYTNSSGDVAQSTWRMHYYDIGQNNMNMIKWAAEEKKWDYVGVGQAIFAWSWLTLTDYYGDVILDEAFNTDLVTFKYNTQPEVYDYVRKLCFQAIENLNKTGDGVSQANLAKGDAYFYNGDVNKWKKFVYGVLARWHNHLSNKSTYNADSVIYYTNLAMTDNADNAMVKYANTNINATKNYYAPIRNNFPAGSTASPTAIRQGLYIANLETGKNSAFPGVEDPRAWYMLRGNVAGTIEGVQLNKGQRASPLTPQTVPENFWGVAQAAVTNGVLGFSDNNTVPSSDANARFVFRNDAPFPIMTASEMKFIKAEAAYKKGDKTTALQAYKEGISLNFDMLTTTYPQNIPTGKTIDATTKNAYLNNPVIVPASTAGLTLNKIMLQKYISMFAHGILETWVDMRRYHYVDSESGVKVYTDFNLPTGSDLFVDNASKPVYRVRPRFNSEYVWNILELQRIGATANDYHTKPMWFSLP